MLRLTQPWMPAQSIVAYVDDRAQNGIKIEDSNTLPYSESFPSAAGGLSIDTDTMPSSLPHDWSHGSDSSTIRSAGFQSGFDRGPHGLIPDHDGHKSQHRDSTANQSLMRRSSYASQHAHRYSAANITVNNISPLDHPQSPHNRPSDQVIWQGEMDDDYFDVESEEDNSVIRPQIDGTASHDLGPVIAMSASRHSGGIRSMTGFLNEPNILTNYEPPYTVNPLMDPRTARVFCHFITATGPTLAVCERHPSNPPIIFSGVPVPKSQRALWTYTLPMKALKHQGLLHSMLALASLHISKLQGTSPMPSLKHYHYALKRVSKSLGNIKKKRDVATLAATLLLGYYEVTTAEHNKWNSHLSGARQLIMDIDFVGTHRKVEVYRNQQESRLNQHQTYDGNGGVYGIFYPPAFPDDVPSKYERQLDENLVSTLWGRQLRYNQYGQIEIGDLSASATGEPPSPYDIETFETQSDLFWWYAKQDMYQSIVSGNRLL